jgi:hypothetical protein
MIDTTIFVRMPVEFGGGVYKLLKSVYGLKQAGKLWHECFRDKIIAYGAKPIESDPCVFVKTVKDDYIIMTVHVDDVLMATTNDKLKEGLITHLRKDFEMTVDNNPNLTYCGLSIKVRENYITVDQSDYIDKITAIMKIEQTHS